MTAALMIESNTATAASMVLAAPVGVDKVMTLDQLDLSESNVRKKFNQTDVQRMAAFLEAQGQLHPPLVHIGTDGRGKVHAGGMRLRGFWFNRDNAKIAADFPVKVTVYDEGHAVELSTAESSVSKDQLVVTVTEVESAEAAKPMTTMKKGDAVFFAAAKLEDKRWLPSPLKRKAVPASAYGSDADEESEQE